MRGPLQHWRAHPWRTWVASWSARPLLVATGLGLAALAILSLAQLSFLWIAAPVPTADPVQGGSTDTRSIERKFSPSVHDALKQINQILDTLEWGNLAFSAPPRLQLHASAQVQLLLSQKLALDELRDRISATGERVGDRIRVSDRMEARLTGGPGLKILASTPEIQALGGPTTEWRWQIQAAEPGQQNLHLTL